MREYFWLVERRLNGSRHLDFVVSVGDDLLVRSLMLNATSLISSLRPAESFSILSRNWSLIVVAFGSAGWDLKLILTILTYLWLGLT